MDEKMASQIDRITCEMYHPENILFMTSWHPTWCTLCNLYLRKSEIFGSFEELIYHLDIIHMPYEPENAILAEEAVIKALFIFKRTYEEKRGRFSN